MLQEILLVGNLGRDPEMRYFPDGGAVTNFSLAVNEVRGRGDEQVKTTVWFRVSIFGKQAEACNTYLQSGSQVLVKGKLKFDDATGGPKMWTRQDGTLGTSFEVHAFTVKFLSGGGQAGEQASHAQQAGEPEASYGDEEDEIPF
ncbi:MAG: single-stranded DNA-binding protein [Planctomycetota bacterium]|jgi:single-strand DNA-binding protein